MRVKWFTQCGYGHTVSLSISSCGGPRRRCTNRRASPPIQSAHLPLEAINATRACHPPHSMLVKQICQQVLLIICQSIEQREQVRIVTQHYLFREDGCCG